MIYYQLIFAYHFNIFITDQLGYLTADSLRKYVGSSLSQEHLEAMIASAVESAPMAMSPFRPFFSPVTTPIMTGNISPVRRRIHPTILEAVNSEDDLASMTTDSSGLHFQSRERKDTAIMSTIITEELFYHHLTLAGVCAVAKYSPMRARAVSGRVSPESGQISYSVQVNVVSDSNNINMDIADFQMPANAMNV